MYSNYYIEIGNRIKELRLKKNMTKTELAKNICSVSYITRIENGERCPTSVILRQLTNKLGVTPENLFRVIESPTGLDVKKLLNQLMIYAERFDFSSILNIINKKEENLQISSIHDLQIIRVLKCFSSTILKEDYANGLEEINKILALTYNNGSNPTDVEFASMSVYGLFLLKNKQYEEAYDYLIELVKYINNIDFIHSLSIIPQYYIYLILSCIETNRYNNSLLYIDLAINYSKKNNQHALLPILYFFKGEVYFHLDNNDYFEIWKEKAFNLQELIKISDDEFFYRFTKDRLDKIKTSQ